MEGRGRRRDKRSGNGQEKGWQKKEYDISRDRIRSDTGEMLTTSPSFLTVRLAKLWVIK